MINIKIKNFFLIKTFFIFLNEFLFLESRKKVKMNFEINNETRFRDLTWTRTDELSTPEREVLYMVRRGYRKEKILDSLELYLKSTEMDKNQNFDKWMRWNNYIIMKEHLDDILISLIMKGNIEIKKADKNSKENNEKIEMKSQ